MWSAEHERLAKVSFIGGSIRIADVRDFTWRSPDAEGRGAQRGSAGPSSQRFITRTLGPDDLSAVHLITERLPVFEAAHVFVCFETDLDPLCVSIEARLRTGERYSLVRGLYGRFELAYVFATGHDRIGLAIDAKERSIDACELVLSPSERYAFLSALANAAAANAAEPTLYNTLRRNCISELCRALPYESRCPLLPSRFAPLLVRSARARSCKTFDRVDRPPFLTPSARNERAAPASSRHA